MNETKRKTYINASICIVVIGVLFYVFYAYFVVSIEDIGSKVKYNQEKIGELNDQMNKIVYVRRSYKNITEKMSDISNVTISSDESMINFIIELENIADKTDINLEKQEKSAGDETYTNFAIKVSGKLNNVMHFLVYLENLDNCVDLEDIKISSGDGMSENVILNANLKVYLKNKDQQQNWQQKENKI